MCHPIEEVLERIRVGREREMTYVNEIKEGEGREERPFSFFFEYLFRLLGMDG
jgi:hypothetical protein